MNEQTTHPRLRLSQLETLQAVQSLDGERGTPAAIGGLTCTSLKATKERCERLKWAGYLYVQLGLRNGQYYRAEYGLSAKGREAIDG